MRAPRNTVGRMFCGPAALAALDGGDYQAALAFCVQARARKRRGPLRGMTVLELCRAFRLAGYPAEYEWGMALRARWTRPLLRHVLRPGFRGVLCLRNHFVAAEGFLLADNHRGPCWWADHPYARHRVRSVISVGPRALAVASRPTKG